MASIDFYLSFVARSFKYLASEKKNRAKIEIIQPGDVFAFTDRPDRLASPTTIKRVNKRWDKMFEDSNPNAVIGFSTQRKPMQAVFEIKKFDVNERGNVELDVKYSRQQLNVSSTAVNFLERSSGKKIKSTPSIFVDGIDSIIGSVASFGQELNDIVSTFTPLKTIKNYGQVSFVNNIAPKKSDFITGDADINVNFNIVEGEKVSLNKLYEPGTDGSTEGTSDAPVARLSADYTEVQIGGGVFVRGQQIAPFELKGIGKLNSGAPQNLNFGGTVIQYADAIDKPFTFKTKNTLQGDFDVEVKINEYNLNGQELLPVSQWVVEIS